MEADSVGFQACSIGEREAYSEDSCHRVYLSSLAKVGNFKHCKPIGSLPVLEHLYRGGGL